MPIPPKKSATLFLLFLMAVAVAAPPAWWSEGDPPVIDVTAVENNKGVANIGQAKHMAKSALDVLYEIPNNYFFIFYFLKFILLLFLSINYTQR